MMNKVFKQACVMEDATSVHTVVWGFLMYLVQIMDIIFPPQCKKTTSGKS